MAESIVPFPHDGTSSSSMMARNDLKRISQNVIARESKPLTEDERRRFVALLKSRLDSESPKNQVGIILMVLFVGHRTTVSRRKGD